MNSTAKVFVVCLVFYCVTVLGMQRFPYKNKKGSSGQVKKPKKKSAKKVRIAKGSKDALLKGLAKARSDLEKELTVLNKSFEAALDKKRADLVAIAKRYKKMYQALQKHGVHPPSVGDAWVHINKRIYDRYGAWYQQYEAMIWKDIGGY